MLPGAVLRGGGGKGVKVAAQEGNAASQQVARCGSTAVRKSTVSECARDPVRLMRLAGTTVSLVVVGEEGRAGGSVST